MGERGREVRREGGMEGRNGGEREEGKSGGERKGGKAGGRVRVWERGREVRRTETRPSPLLRWIL